MKVIYKSILVAVMAVCSMLAGLCSPSFAQSPQITSGLSWLSANQSQDGHWTGIETTDYHSTAEVLATLSILQNNGTSAVNGLNWLNLQAVNDTHYLAERISINGGAYSTSDLNSMLSYRYADGGFGGFGFYIGDTSNVYMTAVVSSTLQQFPVTVALATAINKATTYLISQQQLDGSFNSGGTSAAPTVYETAYAYIALIGATSDATVLGNALNYIKTSQSPDGSWNQDPYSTALALRALYYSEKKPVFASQPPIAIFPVNTKPSSTYTTVTGRIIDSSTGTPIYFADVSVIGTGINGKSDSMGAFTLNGITDFAFGIRASATGYDSLVYTITTALYGTYTIDFVLDKTQSDNLKITSLMTNKKIYPGNADIVVTASIENTSSALKDVMVDAQIKDSLGNVIATIRPTTPWTTLSPFSLININITWNTGRFAPGVYVLHFRIAGGTGILVDEKEVYITIEPSVGVTNNAIVINPGFTQIGATETVALSLSYTNVSNTTANLWVEYEIRTPSTAILNKGIAQLPITPDIISNILPLATFNHIFSESGDYPIQIKIYQVTELLATNSGAISVAPAIRIDLNETILPQTVLPGADAKIKINIRLEGVQQKP